jgi:hypothetical protein
MPPPRPSCSPASWDPQQQAAAGGPARQALKSVLATPAQTHPRRSRHALTCRQQNILGPIQQSQFVFPGHKDMCE